jgi:transposase InsO family protein
MTLTMKDTALSSIKEVKKFLKSSRKVEFRRGNREEAYCWMEQTLEKFGYCSLSRGNKGIMKQYLKKVTGYSRAQLTRFIAQYRKTGKIKERRYKRNRFNKRYTMEDIRLLAKTDELHSFPNGVALKKILDRMAVMYGDKRYENISSISMQHIYNMRKSVPYLRITKNYKKTKPVVVNIGERRRPEPNGIPGYIRVDTVHQGDKDGQKGVYHINTVDEVTQFEFVGAVEQISESYLVPLLARLIESYPFRIVGFHADNGSEYMNSKVARLLNKLLIKLTKSRPRHCNDNALAETKNGSVLRKWMGYQFIEQKHAGKINKFYFGCFHEYINYHRPCGFATRLQDKKGKVKKIYRQDDFQTPYDKLRSIPGSSKYLKQDITFATLDKIVYSKTDNEMAAVVQKQRSRLFEQISPVIDSKLLQAHY